MANAKKKRVLFLITAGTILLLSGYYLFSHYPIGTFKYSSPTHNDLDIQINISKHLGTFQDPEYNIKLRITKNGEQYIKRYTTSNDEISFQVLRRNPKEFIVVEDKWKGYFKCEGGDCGDFFHLEDVSFGINNLTKDTTYLVNYSDSLRADTLSFILFKDHKFTRVK